MSEPLRRRELVATVLEARGDAAVIAGLGSAAWDCHAAGDSDRTFYLWGAMGGATMLGLGVALAQPGRRVLVITGDGEMMMGVGSLSVIAAQAPPNLSVLVLDNEAFGETGRQTGLSSGPTDIAAIARGSGIAAASTITQMDEVPSAVDALLGSDGPALVVAKVSAEEDPLSLPERDGALLHDRFRAALAR